MFTGNFQQYIEETKQQARRCTTVPWSGKCMCPGHKILFHKHNTGAENNGNNSGQKDGKGWKTLPTFFVPWAYSLVFPVELLGNGTVADNMLKAAVDMKNSAFKSNYFNNL